MRCSTELRAPIGRLIGSCWAQGELWAGVATMRRYFFCAMRCATIPVGRRGSTARPANPAKAQAPLRDPERKRAARNIRRDPERRRPKGDGGGGCGSPPPGPNCSPPHRYGAGTHGPYSRRGRGGARYRHPGSAVSPGTASARPHSGGAASWQGRLGKTGDGRAMRLGPKTGVFRRLRVAVVLAEARPAPCRTVSPSAFARFLDRTCTEQGAGRGANSRAIDGLAQVIAQFGRRVPAGFGGEAHVFPRRVARLIVPACSTSCWLRATWVRAGARRDGDEGRWDESRAVATWQLRERDAQGLVAFYPTDSPVPRLYGPICWPMAPSAGPKLEGSAGRRQSRRPWWRRSGSGAANSSARIVDAVRGRLRPEFVDEAVVASTMRELMWDGRREKRTTRTRRCAPRSEGAGAAAASRAARRVDA